MKLYIILMSMFLGSYLFGEIERVVVLSIPKSGTHLLGKSIELLTGKKACYDVSRINWQQHYYPTHELRLLSKHLKYKILTIIRDPRDRLISHIMALEKSGHRKHQDIDIAVIVRDVLTKLHLGFSYHYGTASVYNHYNTLEPFYVDKLKLISLDACIVRFEDLVGSYGGGCFYRQMSEIKKIASYLHVDLEDDLLGYVQKNLFGETITFSSGQIGKWKHFILSENKVLLKKSLGNILIQLGYESDHNW